MTTKDKNNKTNPEPGKKCIFPFEDVDGNLHFRCAEGEDGTFYCATEVNNQNRMIPGKRGICNDKCDKEGIKCDIPQYLYILIRECEG